MAATLNELALRARGEYLRLGASDDYLLAGGLDAQVRYLRAHPQKLAVIGDACVVDQHGQLLHGSAMRDLHRVDVDLYRSASGIRRAVIQQWAVGGAVALLRRSAFDTRAGWDESLRIEDWDFSCAWPRVMRWVLSTCRCARTGCMATISARPWTCARASPT